MGVQGLDKPGPKLLRPWADDELQSILETPRSN